MRPLNAFTLTEADLKARLLDPASPFGATDVRWVPNNEGKMGRVVYFVPRDIPSAHLSDLVAVVRQASAPTPCSVSGWQDGRGTELWSTDRGWAHHTPCKNHPDRLATHHVDPPPVPGLVGCESVRRLHFCADCAGLESDPVPTASRAPSSARASDV